MPTVIGAFCCNSFAFFIRSAYDPFGGALEGTADEAIFEAVDVTLSDVGFVACFSPAVVATVRGLGATAVGFELVDPMGWLPVFRGRRSCSSAFRFVPALVFPPSKDTSRGRGLVLRISELALEAEVRDTDGCRVAGVGGGMGDGLPVSMDVSTESRKLMLIVAQDGLDDGS